MTTENLPDPTPGHIIVKRKRAGDDLASIIEAQTEYGAVVKYELIRHGNDPGDLDLFKDRSEVYAQKGVGVRLHHGGEDYVILKAENILAVY